MNENTKKSRGILAPRSAKELPKVRAPISQGYSHQLQCLAKQTENTPASRSSEVADGVLCPIGGENVKAIL